MGVAVGEATHAATAGAIAYEELPPVTAKGKAESLKAFRALEPISRVVDERDHTPFVGRDLELMMLTQLFERSRTRPATEFATIVGDPGLGKSRLVRELSRYVEDLPELVRWRVGRCLPYGEGIGFWALGEVVKAEAGILETDDQDTLRSKLERAVVEPDPQTGGWIVDRLAPLVGLGTTTAAPEQQEAFTAWRRFLESLATQAPTVIVIEDLHWADAGFVAFLEHLAERTAGLPILMVVTARPEVEERHPSWPPGRRSTVLSLSPLTDQDLEALVRTSLPDASDELTAIVLERAGGSPLYAEQLAAMLHERALPITGGSIDESMVPQSVQALIAARIDALAPERKRVLMEASVVGKTFWAGAVASLGDHADLEDTLAELVRREFCRPATSSTIEGDREYSFWHALVRDVAYAELTKAERARLHAGVASWISDRTREALGEEAEIVVYHLDAALELAASAPELDTASLTELLGAALLAAGEASMRTDAAAADRLLERAMRCLDVGTASYHAAASLRGISLLTAGRPADAIPLLERASAVARMAQDHESATDLVHALSAALVRSGRSDRALETSESFLVELGSQRSKAKAQHLGHMAGRAIGLGDEERARSLCEQGVAICAELDIPLPEELLNARGGLKILRGELEGEHDVRAAVALYLESGRPGPAMDAMWNLGASLREWIGSQAAPIEEEAIELGRDHGVGDVNSLLVLRLLQATEEGRWGDLDAVPTLAASAREAGNVEDESLALLMYGTVELERTGFLSCSDRLLELAATWRPPFWIMSLGASVLSRCPRADVRDAGLGLLRELADVEPGTMWRFAIDEVWAAIRAGQPALARRLAPDPAASTGPSTRADATAATGAIAELDERWDQAMALYGEAEVGLRRLGYAWTVLEPSCGIGRCLIRVGRVEEGIAKLRESRAVCETLGASVRIEEIDGILADVSEEGT
jgi:hypothetical protein